jgi:serine/threonine protein kinase
MKLCPKCEKQFPDDLGFCPHDGTVLAEHHTALIGRVLDGQYEIEAFIAAGGMGAVYRARHILLGDAVAIKILPAGMRQNAEWLKRFQREGQAARRFRHPNAVVVHDLRTSDDGLIYLVMEFVAGTTLDEMLHQSGRIAPAAGLPIIEAVAGVLDAAHAQGVVHRDLKPSNIMITDDGTVKLLDLGIAKIRDLAPDQAGLTTEGQFLGTPYFMSPEQWGEIPRDGGHEIDGRADIYSLGVVVYQMTAGALPFRANTTLELRRAHVTKSPEPLEQLNLNVPLAWSQAVLRALSKDRADRQATAGEFGRELHDAAEGAGRLKTPRSTAPTLLNGETASHVGPNTGVMVPVTGSIEPGSSTPVPTTPSLAAAPPTRSWTMSLMHNRGCQVSLTVAAMLVIAVGIGIPLLLYELNSGTSRNVSSNANAANSNTPTPTPQPTTTPAGDEFLKLRVMVATSPLEEPQPLAGNTPVAPGQIVQFTLTPSVKGYLYLFGHDDQGAQILIPGDLVSGHPYVELAPGEEITVPNLQALKVRATPGDEIFTLVVSNQKLPFADTGTGDGLPTGAAIRKLTSAEIQAVGKMRDASPKVVVTANEGETQVRLAQPAGDAAVVFSVGLQVGAR